MDSSESETLDLIDNAKRVFLLEPDYRRKYPPLGLMKIAGRVRRRGGKVAYGRNYLGERCDLICCTSLFTFEAAVTRRALRQAVDLADGIPIVLGGVYATLMPKHVTEGLDGVRVFAGYSKELDQEVPDYSFPWPIEKPWDEFSYIFTTRGCPNKCAYCAVPRIERTRWINPTWRDHIVDEKPCVMICDNNLSSCGDEHLEALVSYLADNRKKVSIDSGIDCKLVTPDVARLFSRLSFARHGMRLAFDRIEEDGVFQSAVQCLQRAGIRGCHMVVFVLCNFTDTPREADYRMRECVRVGTRPYPQIYRPLNGTTLNRKYIGKHWTPGLLNKYRNFWLIDRHGWGLRKKHGTFDKYLQRSIVPEEDRAAWDVDKAKWEGRGRQSAAYMSQEEWTTWQDELTLAVHDGC